MTVESMIEELPFPVISVDEEGNLILNSLAKEANLADWIGKQCPPTIKEFFEGKLNSIGRIPIRVGDKDLIASGRTHTGIATRMLRIIPKL